jgi:hypothetical protein
VPYPLNNVATVDEYTTGTTLECPRSVRLNLDISNAAIFVQLGLNTNVHKKEPQEIQQLLGSDVGALVNNVIYGKEFLIIPKSMTLSRIVDSIRIRSGAVGKPARVSITAWKQGEIIG